MTELTDAIGQPLRVGQAVIRLLSDDPPTPGHIRRIVDADSIYPTVILDEEYEGEIIEVEAFPKELVVIGSSVADVDARAAGGSPGEALKNVGRLLWKYRDEMLPSWPTVARDAGRRDAE